MLERRRLLLVPIALLVLAIGIVLLLEPMPQAASYHRFADTRVFLGAPNFINVFSNAGFLLVGLFALATLLRQHASLFSSAEDARPYLIFFGAVTLIAFGSGYYHWNPSNETLLWDRLPMSVAYMAFSAAVVADRISARAGNGWLLVVLLVVGVASLVYWYWSEANGRGDLRFYILVQFYPVLALPIIARAFPDYRYVPGRYLAWVIAWFLVSKVLEHLDDEIFALSGQLVSGHSLKHLASAIAAWLVFRMLTVSAHTSAKMVTFKTG
jgi:hypothetical protein